MQKKRFTFDNLLVLFSLTMRLLTVIWCFYRREKYINNVFATNSQLYTVRLCKLLNYYLCIPARNIDFALLYKSKYLHFQLAILSSTCAYSNIFNICIQLFWKLKIMYTCIGLFKLAEFNIFRFVLYFVVLDVQQNSPLYLNLMISLNIINYYHYFF